MEHELDRIDEALAEKVMLWHKETKEEASYDAEEEAVLEQATGVQWYPEYWRDADGKQQAFCVSYEEDGVRPWSPTRNMDDMMQVEGQIRKMGYMENYILHRVDRSGWAKMASGRWGMDKENVVRLEAQGPEFRARMALRVVEFSNALKRSIEILSEEARGR